MDHFLSDAKRLVQRLQHHDNAVDILIGETTNLQNKLIAMRQYRDEINKMNQSANHRPRSTLILGSQLENQRIQNLEQENRELSISLAEHQSALELIMNKYREQVLVMMKANGTNLALQRAGSQPSANELQMSEQIAEMVYVMRQSASMDEDVAVQEIEAIRSLQIENDNLRELLQISGKRLPTTSTVPNVQLTSSSTNASSFLASEIISNKDSGIYEEEFSPNIDVIKKGKRRVKLTNSKHVESLENIFKVPEKSSQPENNSVIATSEEMKFSDYDEDDKPYQMYTVEALVQHDDPEEPLTNGDIRDEYSHSSPSQELHKFENTETPDNESTPSIIHQTNVNIDFKDVVSKNDINNENENINNDSQERTEQDDVLQLLDGVLDLSDDEDETGEDDHCSDQSDSNSVEELSNDNKLSDNSSLPPETIERDNSILPMNKTSEETVECDLLDDLDAILESNSNDADSTLYSDAESETTVTEEDDALALFDLMLDDEMENDSEED